MSQRCRMIGCEYEAIYSDRGASRRAMGEHLATTHGIGRMKGAEAHLGCFYGGCGFKVAGSPKFTETELRAHLISIHGVDPENPTIPAEARSRRSL